MRSRPRTCAPTGSSASSSSRASSRPSSRSPSAGGRQSSWSTVAPWRRGGTANSATPTFRMRQDVRTPSVPAPRQWPQALAVIRPRPSAGAAPPTSAGQPSRLRRCSGASSTPGRARAPPPGAPSPCGSVSVPQTEPTMVSGRPASGRDPRRARSMAGRDRAGRIGVAAVAEHDVQQDDGRRRIVGAPPTICSLRRRKSIIGCGRPTVYSSSPRSITENAVRRRAADRGSGRPPSRACRRCTGRASSRWPGAAASCRVGQRQRAARRASRVDPAGIRPRAMATARPGRILQGRAGVVRPAARARRAGIPAQEVDDDRLAGRLGPLAARAARRSRRAASRSARRLGLRVGGEPLDPEQHHRPADRLGRDRARRRRSPARRPRRAGRSGR